MSVCITRNKRKIAPLSGGEANTASNVGVGGVGVFDGKVGIDLQFKSINVGGNAGVAVADDLANNEIDVELDVNSLTIDNLPNASGTDVVPYNDAADANKPKSCTMATIVNKGGGVLKSLFGANSLLFAKPSGTPNPIVASTDESLLVYDSGAALGARWEAAAASTFVGRTASSDIKAMSIAEAQALLFDAKFRRHSFIWYIESPANTDDLPARYIHDAATLTSVVYVTGAGTVDFNIEKRSKLTPDVAGTNIWTVDKTANTTGAESTSFDSAAVAAQTWLTMDISGTPGAGPLWVAVVLTTDL